MSIFRLSGIAARRQQQLVDPSDIDDCTEVLGRDEEGDAGNDEFEIIEPEFNDCSNPGGHIWLRDICLHCKSRAPA